MRIFEHPNTSTDWKCPICGTDVDKPVFLAGIVGTHEGRNMEAVQVHVECFSPIYYPDMNLIAASWD